MTDIIVNSSESLQRAIGDLRQFWDKHKFLRLKYTSGKKRSLDHNAVSWIWYGQISRELGEDSVDGVHEECKLRFGVPILRAEDADFREIYDASLKHLSYEQKLKAMRYIPVTSLMSVDQMKRYCDAMQANYAGRGVQLVYQQDEARAAA